MPRETEFGKSLISISDVIEKKYLKDRNIKWLKEIETMQTNCEQ